MNCRTLALIIVSCGLVAACARNEEERPQARPPPPPPEVQTPQDTESTDVEFASSAQEARARYYWLEENLKAAGIPQSAQTSGGEDDADDRPAGP